MKAPGVYVVEKNPLPATVVEVATAVPAFVGYTERADNRGKPLTKRPWKITSMAEYELYFGGPPASKFTIVETPDAAKAAFSQAGKHYALAHVGKRNLLYHAMLLFFMNGGGTCYVVAVGPYGAPAADPLVKGIEALVKEQEPTMLVVPECMQLADRDACKTVQQEMLRHCGLLMRNRVAILDIFEGDKPRQENQCIEKFRESLGTNHLDYAAAYYPWLQCTVVQERDVTWEHIANAGELVQRIKQDLGLPAAVDDRTETGLKERCATVDEITRDWAKFEADKGGAEAATSRALLHRALTALSPIYRTIVREACNQLNLLPPSPAMAGIYAMVDNTRGVWKAPANVSVAGVSQPALRISQPEQEDLNITPQGKSINAIRSFIGEGVLVWGARTLDGNSLDWRYINVRRTAIMLEESCKLAAKALVFEPNVSATWVTIKNMIQNFLTSVWQRGGLAGAVPEDAFSVNCGLGETMTPEDILEGILRVTVLVAISRPAEFIEITFQQQMQKS